MFDLGMPPHGGLAIGLERLTCQVLNLPNVRQAVLYPLDRYKITPEAGIRIRGVFQSGRRNRRAVQR